ncbi:hypothetical protein RSAG8_05867, partial [Rhizoctonia solani AG-8 WAC10335]
MENSRRLVTPSDDDEGDNTNTRKRVRWNNGSDSSRAVSVEEVSSSDKDIESRMFAAVTGFHGRVGGVYFNPENATLYLMEDTTDGAHFDLMRMFLEQTKVDVCLVSSRADEHLIVFCQEFMELRGGQCQVRPHKEFVPHKGQAKLKQLSLLARLPRIELDNSEDLVPSDASRNVNDFIDSRRNVESDPNIGSESDPNTQQLYAAIRLLNFGADAAPFCLSSAAALLEQLLRVHVTEELDNSEDLVPSDASRNVNDFIDSRRNVESDPNMQQLYAAIRLLNFGADAAPFCLSSAAALLEQLLRVHVTEELDETQNHLGALHVNSIEILSLNQVMQVNSDALASLQIFDDENHASIHSDKTKEGHSLFQLLNHTSTHLGRSLLRRWCLRPSLSMPTITARHAAIGCFALAENKNTASNIRSNLSGLCQVPKAMALLRTGRGRLLEWRGVAKFAYHVNLLKDTV